MLILCVDPAITEWGYSIIELNPDFKDKIIEQKTFKLSSKLSKERRWVDILNLLRTLVKRFNIDLIITESQFKGSLLQTMTLCGIIAGEVGLPIKYLAPLSWKKWGIGNHKASKEEVREKVVEHFPELKQASEHVCDSVGFYLAYKNNNTIGEKSAKPNQKGRTATKSFRRKVRSCGS